MICRGLCGCTEMVGMCVLYVSFVSKVRPRTFACVAMGSALLCNLGPDCLVKQFAIWLGVCYFVVECDGVVECGWSCSIGETMYGLPYNVCVVPVVPVSV